MGKRIIRLLGVCFMSCLLAMGVQAEEDGQTAEASIEQIYLNMPQITVYGQGLGEAGEQVQAYLGTELLRFVSAAPFSQTGEGIDYYILLDISNSMPSSYFTRLKSGIGDFGRGLSGQDRVSLITFGESVRVLADRTRDGSVLETLLEDVENKDNRTLLFEAVSQAADLSGRKDEPDLKRKAIVVISDGEDVAVGRKMAQEALDGLKEKAVPVYGLCIRDTARENINSFGEFARMSGGGIRVFSSEESDGILKELKESLAAVDVLELTASSNQVSNSYETFSLHMPQLQVPLNKEVLSWRWIPDQEAPVLLEAVPLEGRQIKVTFSEPVSGSGSGANYLLRAGEKTVPIGGVALSGTDASTVIITAAEPYEAGTYTLGCVHITDNSQEQNPVSNTLSLTLGDSDPAQPEAGGNDVTTAIAGAGLLIAAAAVATGVVLYKKIKKNRGVVFMDGKAVMASGVDIKQHVAIAAAERKKFQLLVTVAGRNPKKLELSIDRSMMVGRSDICDLYFDDPGMSRQHFALEWDGQNMYITDLETTNGTSVNGVKVKGRRKLSQGDRITAGAEELIIQW